MLAMMPMLRAHHPLGDPPGDAAEDDRSEPTDTLHPSLLPACAAQVMMRAMISTMIAPPTEMMTCSRNGLPRLSLILSCWARKPPTTEPIRPAISQPMKPAAAADDQAGKKAGDEADDDPGDDRSRSDRSLRLPPSLIGRFADSINPEASLAPIRPLAQSRRAAGRQIGRRGSARRMRPPSVRVNAPDPSRSAIQTRAGPTQRDEPDGDQNDRADDQHDEAEDDAGFAVPADEDCRRRCRPPRRHGRR